MFPLKMYSIYDVKGMVFHFPFPAENDDVAIRSFQQLLVDRQYKFANYPQDCKLFRVGAYHQDSGAIDAEGEVVKISDGPGGPGVSAEVEAADMAQLAQLRQWIQGEASKGIDVRKLLEAANGR